MPDTVTELRAQVEGLIAERDHYRTANEELRQRCEDAELIAWGLLQESDEENGTWLVRVREEDGTNRWRVVQTNNCHRERFYLNNGKFPILDDAAREILRAAKAKS